MHHLTGPQASGLVQPIGGSRGEVRVFLFCPLCLWPHISGRVRVPLRQQRARWPFLLRGSSNSISAFCPFRPRGGCPLGASVSCSHLCMEQVCISFPRSRMREDFSWRSGVLPCSPLDLPGLIAEPGCRTLRKQIQKTLSSRKPQGFRESLPPSPQLSSLISQPVRVALLLDFSVTGSWAHQDTEWSVALQLRALAAGASEQCLCVSSPGAQLGVSRNDKGTLWLTWGQVRKPTVSREKDLVLLQAQHVQVEPGLTGEETADF